MECAKEKLSSTASMQKSLEAIRNGMAGLSEKRKKMLLRVPECDDWAVFEKEILGLLKTKKLRLIAHTHPDYGEIEPSKDDREFLKIIGQKTSVIISYITGMECEFSASIFEDL